MATRLPTGRESPRRSAAALIRLSQRGEPLFKITHAPRLYGAPALLMA